MKQLFSPAVFFLVLFLAGCRTDTFIVGNGNLKQMGAVTLAFGEVPTGIARVVATLSRPGDSDRVMLLAVSDSGRTAAGTFTNIPGGTWHLRVNALDSAGVSQYSGSADVEIVPGQTTVITLELSLSNGALEIHVLWGSSCSPAPHGLVSWWPGDGNGNEVIGGNNGVFYNGASVDVGLVGEAFSFNGVDSRISVPDAENLKFTGSFSIEMWIKIASIPNYPGNYILFRGDDRGGLDPYAVGITPEGELGFQVTSKTNSFSIHAHVPAGRFTHIAATLDSVNGAMKLYVDGVLGAAAVTDVRPFRDLDTNYHPGVGIGNTQGSSYNYPFSGLLDEVSLYDRTLSAQEVSAIFNAGQSGKCRQR